MLRFNFWGITSEKSEVILGDIHLITSEKCFVNCTSITTRLSCGHSLLFLKQVSFKSRLREVRSTVLAEGIREEAKSPTARRRNEKMEECGK